MSLSLATRVSEFCSETPANPRFAFAAAAVCYARLVFLPRDLAERESCLQPRRAACAQPTATPAS